MASLFQDFEIITPNHLKLFTINFGFVFVFFPSRLIGTGFCSNIISVKSKIMIEFVNEISSLSRVGRGCGCGCGCEQRDVCTHTKV